MDTAVEQPRTLQAIRETLFNQFFLFITIGSTLIYAINVSIIFFVQGVNPELRPAIMLLVFWLIHFMRDRIWYTVRAGLFIVMSAIMAGYLHSVQGIAGTGPILLLTTVLYALAFLRWRWVSLTLQLAGMLFTAWVGSQIKNGELVIAGFVDTDTLADDYWVTQAIAYTFVAGLAIYVLNSILRYAIEAVNRQASLSEQLEEEQRLLEKRISERTRSLALTAEVGRSLSNILDRNQLLFEVVDQIQTAFGYYHVHIYLLDEAQQNLLMAGGTGETGKALLIGRHKIAEGKGLVGRAAIMNIPILVPDVSKDKNWLPNALLPETKSEIAIPITVGDDVLGVLDVQEDRVNGLSEEDVDFLRTIANQIGVALRNATVYEQINLQATRQDALNTIGQKIQLSPTLDLLTQTVARELGPFMEAKRLHVGLALNELIAEEASLV